MKTRDLIICSLFASITSILAQISIPLPGGVPFTMQTLAVSLTGIVLGSKKGFITQCIYILLGVIGMPVFSSFSGGIQVIFGPTGGFILSLPIMAYLIGVICERTNNKKLILLTMILASIVNYIAGTLQFAFITKMSMRESFMVCVAPFIIIGLVKAVLATVIGSKLKENKSTSFNVNARL